MDVCNLKRCPVQIQRSSVSRHFSWTGKGIQYNSALVWSLAITLWWHFSALSIKLGSPGWCRIGHQLPLFFFLSRQKSDHPSHLWSNQTIEHHDALGLPPILAWVEAFGNTCHHEWVSACINHPQIVGSWHLLNQIISNSYQKLKLILASSCVAPDQGRGSLTWPI